MKKDYQSILLNEIDETQYSSDTQNAIFMGGALVFINLLLMTCLGLYWTNTSIHQYFSGRPL